MVQNPALLLRDGRKLIYGSGAPTLSLGRLQKADIVSGGDNTSLSYLACRAEEPDNGHDFEFIDISGRKIAIEVKLLSRKVSDADLAKMQLLFAKQTGPDELPETWLVERDGSRLTIFAALQMPKEFGLIDIVSENPAFTLDEASPGKLDSAHVEQRAKKWISDVSQLFDQAASWATALRFTTEHKPYTPMHEELMQRFGVKSLPQTLLAISKGKTVVATLIPIGLWVIGANGRIDLLTVKQNFMLINAAPYPDAADWKIVSLSSPPSFHNFDQDFFKALLNETA